MTTSFKISLRGENIGNASLNDRGAVRYTPNMDAGAIMEAQRDGWLSEFRPNVRRLVRSVGHYGKYSITECLKTGIVVERL